MCYCSIFQQLFKFIPRYRFDKMVEKVSSDRYCKSFSAWQQFLTCLYAQITGKDSLREIASGLATNQSRLYHLGMAAVVKSTLADAMNRRSPDIFEALFKEILDRTIACAPGHGFKFHNPLRVIDSTTIDLCLTQYDWAYYRKHKGAIKLHTELDLSGNIPCFVQMSNGKMSDIRAAKENIVIVPDSIYTFDKGYYDLSWFQQINYIAPIESRTKLRECQKGVLDGREKTMDRTGEAVNRVAGAERDLQCQRTVQRTWHHSRDVLQMAGSTADRRRKTVRTRRSGSCP